MKLVIDDIEDPDGIGHAIHCLWLWEDMLRVLHDPDLHEKFDALLASHASLPVDDAVEAPQTRPETPPQPAPKAKKRRSAAAQPVDQDAPVIAATPVIAAPPIAREDLHQAAVQRGIVWASMVCARLGATRIGELTDDQLQAALDEPA